MPTTTIDQTTPTQPRTQRFYCPGCREWHESPRLLDAIRSEAERIRIEQRTPSDSNSERGLDDDD